MSKIPSSIVGACGEHYVSALLSGLGLIVALPRGGVPSTDLIVTGNSCERAVSIQVKTGRYPFNERKKTPEDSWYAWDTGAKVIELRSPSLWYAYVNLNNWPLNDKNPEVFFVPSSKVSDVVKEEKSQGNTRLFFWLGVNDAKNYLGLEGAKNIIDYLNDNS